MAEQLAIGTVVRAHNKTGTYIGEISGERDQKYLVRVLAVVKHPMQGDLHNPKQADVPFFHERKALAYREQVYIFKHMVKPFNGEVPDYQKSLRDAFENLKADLEKEDSEFAMKSLKCLAELEKGYFK